VAEAGFYLPQAGSFSQMVLLKRIFGCADRCVSALRKARSNLNEANSLTRILKAVVDKKGLDEYVVH